ncbi:MAG: pyrroline-5-carboxylate reductase [Thaumarchaeota archaeon]|jgi:pyrroline-5-carboxylate reductase|nr:pyrroline-5-carboxylate reductase [Nitrososphaerota archaeon]
MTKQKTKIAILGAGKMGKAMVSSLKSFDDYEICATARSKETIEEIKKLEVKTLSNVEATKESEVIIVSVKPSQLEQVLKEVSQYLTNKIVVSIVAGVPIKWIEKYAKECYVYRAMPNINILSNRAITALSTNSSNEDKMKTVESIFKKMGEVVWVEEKLIDVFTALSGSGPAFVCEIINAFVMAGVACGLPKEISYKTTLELFEGTIRTLKEKRMLPSDVEDLVITPGGTTIKGIVRMEEGKLKYTIVESIKEAYERAKEISGSFDALQ